jgi:hypothetical protein
MLIQYRPFWAHLSHICHYHTPFFHASLNTLSEIHPHPYTCLFSLRKDHQKQNEYIHHQLTHVLNANQAPCTPSPTPSIERTYSSSQSTSSHCEPQSIPQSSLSSVHSSTGNSSLGNAPLLMPASSDWDRPLHESDYAYEDDLTVGPEM